MEPRLFLRLEPAVDFGLPFGFHLKPFSSNWASSECFKFGLKLLGNNVYIYIYVIYVYNVGT